MPSNVMARLRPSIILFGDSITQFGFGENGQVGWCGLLASEYQRRADVFNRGFSGYNTKHAVDLLPDLFEERSQDVLFYTLWFGANDASLPGNGQFVPLEEYGANLATILSTLQKKPSDASCSAEEGTCSNAAPPVIVITPPPFDAETWSPGEEPTRTNENARRYGLEAMRVAEEHGCPYLDVWTLLEGDGPVEGYAKYLNDGLHLSGEGNTAVFKGLMELIKSKYPDLAPMTDGDGRYGKQGVPIEHKLWKELI